MPLIDFNSRFQYRDLVTHALKCPSSIGDTSLPAPGFNLSVAAIARVDHGRWIADCPFGCGGAEMVSIDGSVGFFCCECRNASTGHVPIRVDIPDEATCAQIDAYLSARPLPANRFWSPGETIRDLRRENREHGIRLP